MWGEMTTKPEIITALRNAGVDVPINATETQLRQLLAQTVGAANQQIDETTTASPTNRCETDSPAHSESEPPAAQPANSVEADVQSTVQNDSQHNLNVPHVENVLPPPIINRMIDVDEELDRELARLEKRRQILQLRAELREMEIDHMPPQPQSRRLDFADIQHAISSFSGDDTYGIRKWMVDFQQLMDTTGADEHQRLLFARRLMDPSNFPKKYLRRHVGCTTTPTHPRV